MKARLFTTFVLVVGLALLVPGGARPSVAQSQPAAPVVPVPDRARVSTALRSAPLMFIENVGQLDERARFQVRGDNAILYLAEDGLRVAVAKGINPSTGSGHRLKLSFVGANPHPRLEPFHRLDTHVSYFVGSDSANWRAGVPVWGGVRYVDLYPGVDLEMTGDGGRWTWQLICRSNQPFDGSTELAEVFAQGRFALRDVRLRVEGADALSLESLPSPADGRARAERSRGGAGGEGVRLRLTTALGEYTLPLLQVVGAADANLASPTISGDQVASPFASTIPNSQSATANPQSGASDLLYSTFLGGSGWDLGSAIAVDGKGNAYVTGSAGPGFPTTAGAFDTGYNGGGDAFVVKLNADGTGLAYATFLGGRSDDSGNAIAVDGAGNAYVIGTTWSPDFPTTAGAFDTTYDLGDAFVVKLNADGTGLTYSTFLGGSYWDFGNAIAVDGAGNAYVAGTTESPDFPTTAGAFDRSCGTDGNCNHEARRHHRDAFVVKLNAAGSGLIYATFLGGNDDDPGGAIAVDGAGSAYVKGTTWSPDFPTTAGAFDTSFSGSYDSFVIKLNAAGTGLVYSTFLPWGSSDIAVDQTGNAYVTGSAEADFPATAGAFDTSYNGGGDACVLKLNPDGTGLVYATFLGGSSEDAGTAIVVDGAGNAYVAGTTDSSDFPITAGALDTSYNGDSDTFVVKLNAAGSGLAYATFLGGSSDDKAVAIVVDGTGNTYVTGHTESSNFPTTLRAFDTSYNGSGDAFVAKINTGQVTPTPSPLTNGGFEEGFYPSKGQSIANGWAAYTASGQPTFAGERFTAHSGRWAYKISGCAPFIAGLTQAVSVQSGRTYRVTAYHQLYPPGDGQALLGVQDGTSATQWVGDSVPGVWRPLSQEITVTSNRLTISLQGRNGGGLNTNVYFDDVTVVAVGSP